MMLQPAMRSNWQVCDALPFSTTRRVSPDVAGWSAYPSIAVISISLPDRREGPRADLAADRTRSICGRKWNKRFALHRDHAAQTPPQPMSVLGLVGVIVWHYRLPYSPCLAEQAE